jgi:multisubunit Na+/H+ antiporter MnhC subunit
MLGRLLGGIATSLLFSVFDTWYIKAHNSSPAKLDKSLIGTTFSYAAFSNSIVAIAAGLVANNVAGGSDMVSYQTGAPFDKANYEQQVGASAGGGQNASDYSTTAQHSSSIASNIYTGGFIGPFDVAFMALVACFVMASWLWTENYGEQPVSSDEGTLANVSMSSSHSDSGGESRDHGKEGRKKGNESIGSSWRRAWHTVMSDPQVLLCGLISSLFEGSMYVFVFMWTRSLKSLTPGLEESGGHRRLEGDGEEVSLPFGLIFSTFMVCCMAGSSIFSICMERKVSLESLAGAVFAVASASMLAVALSTSDTVTFVSMNMFEMCVGMYFPTMGTLKSTIVPEHSRSAIYNLYRIPLNAIVLTSLLTDLSVTTSFYACSVMLATAALLQLKLRQLRLKSEASRSTIRPKEISVQQGNE